MKTPEQWTAEFIAVMAEISQNVALRYDRDADNIDVWLRQDNSHCANNGLLGSAPFGPSGYVVYPATNEP